MAGRCHKLESGNVCLPVTLMLAKRYFCFWIGAAAVVYPVLVLIHYFALLQTPAGLVGDSGIDMLRDFGLVEGAAAQATFVFLFLHSSLDCRICSSALNIISRTGMPKTVVGKV